jgi:hypothetical protein
MDAHSGRNRQLYCNSSLLNKIDRDFPSCLQVLRHVYRRGLDWFQQCKSFRLGLKLSLLHLPHGRALWTKRTALLQFLLNKMDRDLPSCLQVLRHVYRRGLDWFQQHWSYIDCFPPPGVPSVKRAHSCCTNAGCLVLAFRGIKRNHFTLMWAFLCNSHKETLLCPRLRMSYIDCFPPPGVPRAVKHVCLR